MSGGIGRRSALGLSLAGTVAVGLAVRDRPEAAAEPPPDPASPMLMFIRHAEDPAGPGAPFGVTEAGDVDSGRSLTVLGWTRAGALIGLFAPRGADGAPLPTRPGLARPLAVFAHDPSDQDSRRSLETVTPLAAALGVAVDLRFTHTQTAELAAALRATSGPTIIAWRHEEIAEIINQLGEVHPPPPRWPEDRFDMVLVVTRSGSGWQLTQVPQMLLAGDRVTPL